MVHSDYLGIILDPAKFKKKLDLAVETLQKVEFDVIAVRGNSGVLFGGALADRMNKGIILVRKPQDDSHSCWNIEGFTAGKKYIFVDDLVFSGITRERVKSEIAEDRHFKHYEFVGEYLYYPDTFYPAARPEKKKEEEHNQMQACLDSFNMPCSGYGWMQECMQNGGLTPPYYSFQRRSK